LSLSSNVLCLLIIILFYIDIQGVSENAFYYIDGILFLTYVTEIKLILKNIKKTANLSKEKNSNKSVVLKNIPIYKKQRIIIMLWLFLFLAVVFLVYYDPYFSKDPVYI